MPDIRFFLRGLTFVFVILDGLQKGPAIARGLLCAHARYLEQLFHRARGLFRHVGERRIGENDVSGDTLVPGKLRAQGAQHREEPVFLEIVGIRAARALFLCARRFKALLHQHAFPVKEHSGGAPRGAERRIARFEHKVAR